MTATSTKPHPLTFYRADALEVIAAVVADGPIKLRDLGLQVGRMVGLDPKTIENAVRAMDRYGWVSIVGSVKARDVVLTDLARILGPSSVHHPARVR